MSRDWPGGTLLATDADAALKPGRPWGHAAFWISTQRARVIERRIEAVRRLAAGQGDDDRCASLRRSSGKRQHASQREAAKTSGDGGPIAERHTISELGSAVS
jgi:hypothetical protein